MLSGMDSLMQSFRCIVIQDRYGLLPYDRSGINSRVDKMHGAAGNPDAIFKGLFPGLQPGKRRQQRRMDIYNPPLEGAEEISFEHPHETGQRHQIDLRLSQRLDISPLGFLFQFGAKLSRGNKARRNVSLPGSLEDTGLRDIADDQRNLSRQVPGRAGLRQGNKIGAFARAEHANTKC